VFLYKQNGRGEWCEVCFKLGARNKDLDAAKVCAIGAMVLSVLLEPVLYFGCGVGVPVVFLFLLPCGMPVNFHVVVSLLCYT
jgi:hypothetical protein